MSVADPDDDGPLDGDQGARRDPDRQRDREPEHEHELDVDSVFAGIVAQWDTDGRRPEPWPGSTGPADGQPQPDPRPGSIDEPRTGAAPLLPADPLLHPDTDPSADVPRGSPLLDPDELAQEGFVPPEPPPLPRPDLITAAAWTGTVLGPVLLLVFLIVWRSVPQLFVAAAVLAFVGGFVGLLLRLPASRDDDSDDDGAVV